jgi:Bacterial SH3 domain
MKKHLITMVIYIAQLFSTSSVFAQAFGEYGRAVGGLPQGLGPRAPGNTSQDGPARDETGNREAKGLPVRLVVAVIEAGLYPKQDDESEKVAQLSQGETLVPLVQSTGGNDWYLVKTSTGVIGWVKSGAVKEQKTKK